MKQIRIALTAGILSFASAAMVAAQGTPNHGRHGQRANAQHVRGAEGKHAGKHAAGLARGQLLKGIQLSDAEKANLRNVHAKYAAQAKTLREQFKPKAGAARITRGDTAAIRARREAVAPMRAEMAKLMTAERAELRAALTPANQAKFDANVQRVEQKLAKRVANGKSVRKAGGRFGRPPLA